MSLFIELIAVPLNCLINEFFQVVVLMQGLYTIFTHDDLFPFFIDSLAADRFPEENSCTFLSLANICTVLLNLIVRAPPLALETTTASPG